MAKTPRVTADECVYGGGHLPPLIYRTKSGGITCGMDWSGGNNWGHPVTWPGYDRPCRICRGLSMLTDCNGKPCHKVCAEAEHLAAHRSEVPA
ncbi:hypothetical protein [Actinoplanes rectilineatus]|uniref:hypothetical protein n=1 Tax=Actinoplanes rectilineatus TaxID=113571 RepID=UPI0005F29E8E|nr:hypothetical protein [Actinoplanes rectilineatus]